MQSAIITGVSQTLRFLTRRAQLQDNLQGRQPKRILLLKSCCLGDVLLTTPLLAALRQGYPEAEITYAVGAWSRPMIQDSPHVDRTITIPDRWTPGSMLAVARELQAYGYDAAFVPERTPLPGIVCWLAGIVVRVGLDSGGRGFTYTRPVAVPQALMHEADLYLLLAKAMGLDAVARHLWFFPTTADRAAAASRLREMRGSGPVVVLHPGGGTNPGMVLPRKRWLPERWAKVADTLSEKYDARILVVGSENEDDAARAVYEAMRSPATILARQWRWGELAALIERASLFLGHDTGMSLLANAVGTPQVVIFGPSDPQVYGPYGPSGVAVWAPTPSSPCFYEGTAPAVCPCAGQCMRNIEPEDVLHSAQQFLDLVPESQRFA